MIQIHPKPEAVAQTFHVENFGVLKQPEVLLISLKPSFTLVAGLSKHN